MKAKKRETRAAAPAAVVAIRQNPERWPYALAAAVAVIAAFWVYSPALHGPFLFDDTVLPFALPGFGSPLIDWLKGPRKFLNFTYWLNARMSGEDPFSYHVVNVLFHVITSGLIFLVVRRLVEWAGLEKSRRDLLAGFAAAVFLLHPVQAEAVAYLAGRSEALSVMLFFAAYAVFLYRKDAVVSWGVAIAVVALFGLGLLSKEHVVVLPALLLLTDYWWNPGFSFQGMRANWRLYGLMALGAAGGLGLFWGLITQAQSAGFGLKDFTWYQYFFTQCRALFVYVGMFLLPVNLTADWDFPISKTIMDHGAIAGLVLLLALVGAGWYLRRRFPLATFGFLTYLLLMAPTSSILPIRDPIAERRLYLSIVGLLLIVVDLLGRVKLERRKLAAACAAIALFAAGAAHARSYVWGDPVALWEDTTRKSPNKSRGHFQLGLAYFDEGRYDRAVAEYERTAQLDSPTYDLLVDWGLAYDGWGRTDDALAKLRQAAQMDPTAHIYTQIAQVYAKREHWADALDALAMAEKIDPNFPWIYAYRGKIHSKMNRLQEAIADYQRALAIQPNFEEARRDLFLITRPQRTNR